MNSRNLKIEQLVIPTTYNRSLKIYSLLRLKGKWLTESGFNPGDEVNVIVEDNRLIIERIKS